MKQETIMKIAVAQFAFFGLLAMIAAVN